MLRKKCPRCGKKISRDFIFCPYCGTDIEKEKEKKNFGFLGRNDEFVSGLNLDMPFGFGKIFNSLLKQIEEQFRELDKEMEKKPDTKFKSGGISISISTDSGEPKIKINQFSPKKKPNEKTERKRLRKEMSKLNAKKLEKLPKKEPETSVRRLSDKIIYEISLPGVKSLKDITINELENSIEIKAVAKDKVYFKLLPVSLPIRNYRLRSNKLILELDAKI